MGAFLRFRGTSASGWALAASWGVRDEEVLEAIEGHVYGVDPENGIGMALYVADVSEPGRGVNEEIRDLFAAGADVVQIDEPYMQARPEKARQFGLKALNRALEGVRGTTAVHICYGYGIKANLDWKETLGAEWRQYEAIFPALAQSRIDQVSLECANSKVPARLMELLAGKVIAALVPGVLAGWLTYVAFVVLSSVVYGPKLFGVVTDASWLAGVFVLGPAVGLASVVAGVIVSSRVNDPRVAQQVGSCTSTKTI